MNANLILAKTKGRVLTNVEGSAAFACPVSVFLSYLDQLVAPAPRRHQ